MQRRLEKEMLAWMESSSRKPLLLRGIRQVGKTWLMKAFGREHFRKLAYVSCDKSSRIKEIFSGDYDIVILINLILVGGAKHGIHDILHQRQVNEGEQGESIRFESDRIAVCPGSQLFDLIAEVNHAQIAVLILNHEFHGDLHLIVRLIFCSIAAYDGDVQQA